MTSCAGIRDQISAYVDGELEAADRTRVSAHLASCAECRDAADEFRAIGDLLRAPAARYPLPIGLSGLASGVISRARAEESQSWGALARRAFDDWHWALTAAGALGSAAFSLAVVWALCTFGPQPAREDSLAALISTLQAPAAGHLWILATPVGKDESPIMMQFGDDTGAAVVAVLPNGVDGPSASDLALALSQAVVSRDGRLTALGSMSMVDRKRTEALLEDIQRIHTMPLASWSGRRVSVQRIEFVTNTDVVGKVL
jgi:anti-sigma factor RsiW